MLRSQPSQTLNMLLEQEAISNVNGSAQWPAGVITCTLPALILYASSQYITKTISRHPIIVEYYFSCIRPMYYFILK